MAGRLPAVPAFPGAEGAGANALGGRGGDVYYVTTLADSGAGSLRSGISGAPSGGRTILFKVSGNIVLNSSLTVNKPRITIAGQTAPGDGICFQNYSFNIAANDIIVRHARTRLGTNALQEADAMWISAGTNIIVDHVSASWSVDETLSASTDVASLTVQNCFITESLNNSIHVKGDHGYGGIISSSASTTYSYLRNLYAHHNSRNPRIGSDSQAGTLRLDFRNNVIYDYGDRAGYTGGTNEFCEVNYVGNYCIAGPSSQYTYILNGGALGTHIYQNENYIDLNENSLVDGAATGWAMFSGTFTATNAPFPVPAATTVSAVNALEQVLSLSGALPWRRDATDARVAGSVRRQNGMLVDFVSATNQATDYITNTVSGTNYIGVRGWSTLSASAAPTDTDNDGMPDHWERNLGLNPAVANNNHVNPSGYTDLEDYLNFLGAPYNVGGVNTVVATDLRALTGYDTNQVFSVVNPTNGTVALAGDGIAAQFSPATNVIGFAYFTFNATNPVNQSAFGPVLVALLITNRPPDIVTQPSSLTNSPGDNGTFSVAAANAGLTYQWRKNGISLVNGGNISGGVTNATLTFTNLVATNAGDYSVVVSNFSGVVTSTAAVLVVSDSLSAPANFTASATNLLINLKWDSVAGATNYNLKRSTTAGGPYPTLFSGLTATNYADANVASGVTYYYVVTAVGDGGDSSHSVQVAASPLPSNQPADITGSLSGNVLTLSWPADHIGWRLQAQTNTLVAIWGEVPGAVATNVMTFVIGPGVTSVFHRLVYP